MIKKCSSIEDKGGKELKTSNNDQHGTKVGNIEDQIKALTRKRSKRAQRRKKKKKEEKMGINHESGMCARRPWSPAPESGECSGESMISDHDDRGKELKAFDDTKKGVKGLVDAGVVKIPKIFMSDENSEKCTGDGDIKLPVIDLSGIRGEIVEEVRIASETWGFFQVKNHGVPLTLLQEILEGIKMFHEQDAEIKKDYYSPDPSRKVKFHSFYNPYYPRAAVANWRDTLLISVSDGLDPQELPPFFRETAKEYIKQITKVGDVVFELLSEALGLKPDRLRASELAKGSSLVCHYYPPCPEPQLAMGTSKHVDPTCFTILLQDQIGGLQVFHENQYWVDVQPIAGNLIINIGDFLQVMSNGKLKTAYHRVVSSRQGPRISAAYQFAGNRTLYPTTSCGPLKEVISEEKPPLYRDFTLTEYLAKFLSQGLHGSNCLDHFKLHLKREDGVQVIESK